ncbi:MAG: hypothetical protein JNL42_18350, partial [Anaerolineae bacterium]|nr:hypothetical protein [Anaerolineae bacterium]
DRVRVLGRQAAGVNSMRLSEGDAIAGMDVLHDDDTHVLVITRRGYGKRTPVEEYRLQGRYGSGIRTIARNEKTGPIVAMRCVNPRDDILMITANSSVLRTQLEGIRDVGRATIGVRVVRLHSNDAIVSMTILDGAPEDELSDSTEIDENGVGGEAGGDVQEQAAMNGGYDPDSDDDAE